MSPTCVPSWMCVIYWMIFYFFFTILPIQVANFHFQEDFYIQIGDVAKVAIIQ